MILNLIDIIPLQDTRALRINLPLGAIVCDQQVTDVDKLRFNLQDLTGSCRSQAASNKLQVSTRPTEHLHRPFHKGS